MRFRSVITALLASGLGACSLFVFDDDGLTGGDVADGAVDGRLVEPGADGAGPNEGDGGADASPGPVRVLVEGEAALHGLAASETFVAWSAPGIVKRLDFGGATTTLAGPEGLGDQPDVAASAADVFFNYNSGSAGKVMRCAPNEPCRTMLSGFANSRLVALDLPGVFAVGSLGVVACDDGSCTSEPRVVTASGDGPFLDLVASGTALFWVTGGNPGRVRAVLKSATSDGGAVNATDVATGQANPTGLTAGPGWLAWTAYDTGAVLRCTLDANRVCANPPTVVYAGDPNDAPGRIVTDQTDLFWIAEGSRRVLRCPVAGCGAAGPVVVMDQLVGPRRIAVTSTEIIVADALDGRILARAK